MGITFGIILIILGCFLAAVSFYLHWRGINDMTFSNQLAVAVLLGLGFLYVTGEFDD